jgi:hypothetical protein
MHLFDLSYRLRLARVNISFPFDCLPKFPRISLIVTILSDLHACIAVMTTFA